MVDDVIVNKVAIIERCLTRVTEEYDGDEERVARCLGVLRLTPYVAARVPLG